MKLVIAFIIIIIGLLITDSIVNFEYNQEALVAFFLGLVSCLFVMLVVISER